MRYIVSEEKEHDINESTCKLAVSGVHYFRGYHLEACMCPTNHVIHTPTTIKNVRIKKEGEEWTVSIKWKKK